MRSDRSSLRRRTATVFTGTRLLPAVRIAAACLVVARFFSYGPLLRPDATPQRGPAADRAGDVAEAITAAAANAGH